MYRVLIVDDEGLERTSLQMIISKEFTDEVVIKTAASGRIAIEVFDEFLPDVILMDISMPGINGLDAIKEIRKRHTGGKFLMLTAYDNFTYVQEAISIGVSAYVTKPFNRQALIGEIRKLMLLVDKEREGRRNDLMLKERLDAAIPMLQMGFLYSVLLKQDASNYAQLLEIEEKYGFFVVIDYHLGRDADLSLALAKSEKKTEAAIAELFKNSIIQQMGGMGLVMCFCQLPSDEYAARNSIIGRANELKEKITAMTGSEVVIGIGSIVSVEELYISYEEASLAAAEGDSAVNHYCDMDIENALEGSRQQEKGIQMESSVPAAVQEAKKYIEDNFKNNITLSEVAEQVHISPYYFSKLFKEKTGCNFIEYLTIKRMETAKSLLKNTEMSVKEICLETGYSDPNYFSRSFKKYEGVTPGEYRGE